MSETPPVLLWENIEIDDGKGGFIVPPEFASVLKEFIEKGQPIKAKIPLGWICPCCGALNRPKVKICRMGPHNERNDGDA